MFSAVEMTYLLVIIFTTYPTNVHRAIKLFSRKELTFCVRVAAHLPYEVFVGSMMYCAKLNKRCTIAHFIVFKVCALLVYSIVKRSRVYQLSGWTPHAGAVILNRFRTNLLSKNCLRPLLKRLML